MDYHLRITAVLLFLLMTFINESTNGQSIAESSFLSRNKQERDPYTSPYDESKAQRPSGAFHDIYTVLGQGGETQRVHYAVDDRGVRANIQSNSVHLGENPDPASIFFGTRLNRWPSSSVMKDSPPAVEVHPPSENIQDSFEPYGVPQLPPQLPGPVLLQQGEVLPSIPYVNPEDVSGIDGGRRQNPRLFIDEPQPYEPLRISKPYGEASLSEQVGELRDFQRVNNPQLPENPSLVGNSNIVPGFGQLVPFRPPQTPALVEESIVKNFNSEPLQELPIYTPGNPYDGQRAPKAVNFVPRVEGLESYLTMFNKPVYDSRINKNPVNPVEQQDIPVPVSQVTKPLPNPIPVVTEFDQFVKPRPPLKSIFAEKPSTQILKASPKPTFPKGEGNINDPLEKSQPERKIPSLFSVLSKTPAKSVAAPESVVPGSLSFTKPLISSPMSTIFDSDKENGQYYHYVMNVGRKPGSNLPGRTKLYSTGNGLYKILNQTGIHFQPDRISYTNKKDITGFKKVTIKPLTTKKAKKTEKKKSNSNELDLYTAGDVEDIIKAVEVPPTPSSGQVSNGFMNESVDGMKEILHITNTEETGTEVEEKSLPFVKQHEEVSSSISYEIQNNVNLISEQNETALPIENTGSNATSQAGKIQVPIYLTEPDPSDEMMGNIQDEESEKENENEAFIDALLSDYATTPAQEITVTEVAQTTEITSPITSTTTESSTTTKPALSETTTSATSTTTLESVTSELPEGHTDLTTTVATLEVSSSETAKDNVTEVMVEVTNSNPTTQESEEIKTKDQAIDSNKPMLELLIQNTEMNDFMSRINNMPIMIRVLNAKNEVISESTVIPDIDESTLKNEVSSTEPTTTIPSEESTISSVSTSTELLTTTTTTTTTEASFPTSTPQELRTETTEIPTKAPKAVTKQEDPKQTKPVTTKEPKKTRSSKRVSTKKNESDQKKEKEPSAIRPESEESSRVETHSPLQYISINPDSIGTELPDFNPGHPDTMQMMGDMGFLNGNDNRRSYVDQRETLLLPMNRNPMDIGSISGHQLIPVVFEDDFHNSPRTERLIDYHDSFPSAMSSIQGHVSSRNISLPAIRDTVNHSPYNLPPVEYVDIMPYEELEHEGTSGQHYNQDAIMYLDNYDTLPENNGNNQYIVLGDPNLELPSGTEIYPLDSHVQQSAILPMKVSPKFGSRISP